MGDNTTAEIFGGDGNDVLWVDGTYGSRDNATYPTNTFNLTLLRWSGGNGDDTINAVFTSNGTTNIDLFNDTAGVNILNIASTNTIYKASLINQYICNVMTIASGLNAKAAEVPTVIEIFKRG